MISPHNVSHARKLSLRQSKCCSFRMRDKKSVYPRKRGSKRYFLLRFIYIKKHTYPQMHRTNSYFLTLIFRCICKYNLNYNVWPNLTVQKTHMLCLVWAEFFFKLKILMRSDNSFFISWTVIIFKLNWLHFLHPFLRLNIISKFKLYANSLFRVY